MEHGSETADLEVRERTRIVHIGSERPVLLALRLVPTGIVGTSF